ncbi:hypothetical protein [Gordonia iterans]
MTFPFDVELAITQTATTEPAASQPPASHVPLVINPLRKSWHELTSMRTALALLSSCWPSSPRSRAHCSPSAT